MKRWKMLALGGVAVAVALAWTLRSATPQPESFAIDSALPAGAVARIGTPLFGPVGGLNAALLALSPDGSRLYTCSSEGMLRAWDADTAEPLWQVAAHADYVPPADADVDRRWEGLRNKWRGYHEEPSDLALSADGRRLATCAGGVIRVFNASTGRCVAERTTSEAPLQLEWTADGRSILRFEEHRVVHWDVDADAETRSDAVATNWCFVAARDDGSVVVIDANRPGRIVFLDGRTLAPARTPMDVPAGLNPTQVMDDRCRVLAGRFVVATPAQPAFRWIWSWVDPADGSVEHAYDSSAYTCPVGPRRAGMPWVLFGGTGIEIAREAAGPRRRICAGTIRAAAVSADGRRAAFAALGRARVYDIASGRFLHDAARVVSPEQFCALPDGRRVLVGAADGALLECEVDTGRVLRTFALGGQDVDEIRVAPDGRVAAGRNGGSFRIDVGSGEVATFKQPFATAVAVRDGRVIGLAALNSKWVIVDIATAAETPLAGAPYTGINNAVFSVDGTAFRAEFPTGKAIAYQQVYDTATGAVLATGEMPSPPRFPAQIIHPLDANGLCSKITDMETGAVLVTFPRPLDPNREGMYPLAADDRFVAMGSPTGAIRLVAREGAREVAVFRGPPGVPTRLEFVPGGRRLLSGHPDGTILVWDVETAGRR